MNDSKFTDEPNGVPIKTDFNTLTDSSFLNKKILFAVSYYFSDGDPSSIRINNLAKICREFCGDVRVVDFGYSYPYIVQLLAKPHMHWRLKKILTLINRIISKLSIRRRLRRYLRKTPRFDFIIVPTLPIPSMHFLKRYSKRKNIKLIHDCVEWASPEQKKYGKMSPSYRKNEYINSKWSSSGVGIIAISQYFLEHFQKINVPVVRIPNMMETSEFLAKQPTQSGKLDLLYVGDPIRKDYIADMIHAVCLLQPSEREKVHFTIAGPNKGYLIKKCGVSPEDITLLGQSLNILGRIPHQKALELYSKTDFSVLLRPENQRCAKAGFPTKFVESISSSTPIICNLTSDLGLYLVHGKNGIVVQNETPEAFSEAVRFALSLTAKQKTDMQIAAHETAEKYFDFKFFVNDMKDFLSRC